MDISILISLYHFELDNLHKEISSYTNDADLWKKREGISNSGGNLCLHVTGSIQHFLGATLGDTGYVRDRDGEFTTTGLSKEALLNEITTAKNVVTEVLGKMSQNDLDNPFPFEFMGKQSTAFYLTRFLAHLSYHLGQVNYHRRLINS